ncbi:MAG: hypothetical protein U1E65_17585 [Myxococcota bacterium]
MAAPSPRVPKQLGPSTALGRFLDQLLQAFEDRRPGLPAATLAAGEEPVKRFFEEAYDAERARLRELMKEQAPHLSDEAREKLYAEVDKLVSTMVIPAYVRTTAKFTPKERNDFYLAPEGLHGLERAGWGLAGIMVGIFVILAPFIPLWSKEWIGVFMMMGLFFPNLRSYLSLRKYERDLNELVARGEREAQRIDRAYLESGDTIAELRQLTDASSEVESAIQRLAEVRASVAEARQTSALSEALAGEATPAAAPKSEDADGDAELAKAREAAAQKQGSS